MAELSESDLLRIRTRHKENTIPCYSCHSPMAGVLDSNVRGQCEPCGGYSNPHWSDAMKREVHERREFRRQRGIP